MEGKDEERTEKGGKSGLDVAHKPYADIFADMKGLHVAYKPFTDFK
jgi:hypothetical protein